MGQGEEKDNEAGPAPPSSTVSLMPHGMGRHKGESHFLRTSEVPKTAGCIIHIISFESSQPTVVVFTIHTFPMRCEGY